VKRHRPYTGRSLFEGAFYLPKSTKLVPRPEPKKVRRSKKFTIPGFCALMRNICMMLRLSNIGYGAFLAQLIAQTAELNYIIGTVFHEIRELS
jgi:hypothetical protein